MFLDIFLEINKKQGCVAFPVRSLLPKKRRDNGKQLDCIAFSQLCLGLRLLGDSSPPVGHVISTGLWPSQVALACFSHTAGANLRTSGRNKLLLSERWWKFWGTQLAKSSQEMPKQQPHRAPSWEHQTWIAQCKCIHGARIECKTDWICVKFQAISLADLHQNKISEGRMLNQVSAQVHRESNTHQAPGRLQKNSLQ